MCRRSDLLKLLRLWSQLMYRQLDYLWPRCLGSVLGALGPLPLFLLTGGLGWLLKVHGSSLLHWRRLQQLHLSSRRTIGGRRAVLGAVSFARGLARTTAQTGAGTG